MVEIKRLISLLAGLAPLLLALGVVGCAQNESRPLPVPVLPDRLAAKQALPASTQEGGASALTGTIKTDKWWQLFGSDELNRLVEKGLVSSPDIRIAETRVEQARARSDQARAGAFPSVTGTMTRSQQAPRASDTGTGETVTVYQGILKGDFKLDVWGEQSAIEKSATLRLAQADFDRVNTRRIVTANIAISYLNYLMLNDRLRVAREIERILEKMFVAVERRFHLGDATVLEFEQQKSGLFAFRATIPLIEQEREELKARIAGLVGAVTGDLTLSENGLASLKLPVIQREIPTVVVFRRPDVRAVEARLQAAGADIDVARARLLPSIDLSTSIGLGSETLASLLRPEAFLWGTLANVVAAIIDNGRRQGEIAFSEAMRAEIAETYLRTIYQSTREIENALNGVLYSESRVKSQAAAKLAAAQGWQVVTKAYEMGAADVFSLLDAERTHHRLQDDFLRTQMEQFRSYVIFYQALGGDGMDDVMTIALQ